MTNTAKCIYCGLELPEDTGKICSRCKVRAKAFEMLREKNEITGEEFIPDSGQIQEESSQDMFPVPREGEIIQGLIKTCRKILDGTIPVEKVPEKMETIAVNVSEAFKTLFEEIGKISIDIEDYENIITEKLDDIEFLFMKGIEEISRFAEDSNPAHIHYGLLLCRTGEQQYIDLSMQVNKDATGSQFTGTENIPAQLAMELNQGRMDKNQYNSELESLEKEIIIKTDKAQALITEGFKLARQYDGTCEDTMTCALKSFKSAQEELSGIILNLHDPGDIKKAMEELIEDFMEEEILE